MKLFVTDYDNTLYIDEESIVKNIEMLNKLQQNGFYVVISTGRCLPSIKEKIIEYNIPFDYLTCADGSIIYDKNYKVLKFYEMNKDIINEIINYKNKIPHKEVQFSYENGYSNLLDLTKPISGINIVIYNNDIIDKTISLFNELKTKFQDYNYLIYNHEPYSFFCIKQANVSKAMGVSFLSQCLNIGKQNIYVIGDSDNDLEMLAEFDGVCVKNSTFEVLRTCKNSYNHVYEYVNEILK